MLNHTINRYFSRYLNRYSELTRKQKQQVQIGGVLFVCFLLWWVVWQPAFQKNESLQRQVQQKSDQLEWVKSAALRIKHTGFSSAVVLSDSELRQKVSQAAQAQKLRISRIQASRDSAVQVQLEGAAFESLLHFIDQLNSVNVTLKSLQVNPGNRPGTVKAQLILGGGV